MWVIRSSIYVDDDVTVHFNVRGRECQEADNFKVNQMVEISFNLNGREWKDKCFNTLKIWKIEAMQDNMPQIQKVQMPAEEGTDLPF